jgi:nicotinate-nucleotide adenylyltransferase
LGERIGIFGGTFDPVHVGHLVAAVNARHDARLDRVLVVVANQPWQKADRPVTSAEDRFAMVEAAVEDVEGIEASRLEIDRGGESMTADTLAVLADGQPGADLFLVVGNDVAAQLATWRRADEVKALASLVVVSRAGSKKPVVDDSWRPTWVAIPRLEISSTDLRERAADGRPLDYLVPPKAVHVIRERGLYAGGQMRRQADQSPRA